jgi:hypothetical protein
MLSSANLYLGNLSTVLYRDADGFYQNLPPKPGFYIVIENVDNTDFRFVAIAKKGKYGALEFYTIHKGEWFNYSENIPQEAVVEFVAMDELQIECFPRLAS